ncbi:putative transposase Ptta/En/Spm plant [Arabidopsis suecica]|uniref:Putative transposase Ptta/En/Spm plant n=1 Tax=Arabidopsis suecica TaxID=45249 RepID=A0A8T2CG23_ARASU|nr:putative transposase Ptta/En/Spm plant [Arabidopsis suecica]
MSSRNDYNRFLSTQNVPAPSGRASRSQGHASRSQGNASRNCNPPSPASQNQQAGLTPPPSNPNSPNPSHSATQLLNYQLGQMYNWDRSINERVRAEFEDKLKDRMCDQVSRWKGKSEINSINSRNVQYHDPDGQGIYKHRSGLTSFKSRARKHFEETGDSTPDFLVVLEQTHRKPNGTFIDRKSDEIYKDVTSRIEEEESQLCSGDNTESSASGRLSVAAKNKIYTLHEASSVHVGPPPANDDPVVLSQKLAAAEARHQSQAEKIHSFDGYFEYLAEKDPVFAGMYRGGFEPENGNATRTAQGNGTETDQTGTETGTGTVPGSSPSQAF